MIAQGFKPVGWVAAVAGAALGCYMLSLNVASERSELAKLERQIIAAKQDIRMLQTELGTRGRMQQLEHWNAEVLALSAPTAAQVLENELTLARFETKEPTIEDKARVTMAAAEVQAPAPARQPQIAAGRKLSPADYAKVAERAAATPQPKVRLASAVMEPGEKPPVVKAAAVKMPAQAKPEAPLAKATAEAKKPAAKEAVKVAATPKKAADKPATVAAKVSEPKPAKAEVKPAKKAEAAKKAETAKTGAGA